MPCVRKKQHCSWMLKKQVHLVLNEHFKRASLLFFALVFYEWMDLIKFDFSFLAVFLNPKERVGWKSMRVEEFEKGGNSGSVNPCFRRKHPQNGLSLARVCTKKKNLDQANNLKNNRIPFECQAFFVCRVKSNDSSHLRLS